VPAVAADVERFSTQGNHVVDPSLCLEGSVCLF
jgi:hypothetical protein